MTPEALRQRLCALWPLPWRIDPGATDPAVVAAEVGGLCVAVGLTIPLTVVGVLDDEDFYEEQTDDLAAALAELDRAFRARVALN